MLAYKNMFRYVGEYLGGIEEVEPPPLHSSSSCWETLDSFAEDVDMDEESATKFQEVLECFHIGFTSMNKQITGTEGSATSEGKGSANSSEQGPNARMQHLLSKPQSAQRTEEWYKEMNHTLTASEFCKVFGSPRGRALLVMSKAGTDTKESFALRPACMTAEMSPFDWGIRFEPVAKMLLEEKWSAKIEDLGRIRHPTLASIAASEESEVLVRIKLVGLKAWIEIMGP